MILAWIQSWNIFEKLMKLWSLEMTFAPPLVRTQHESRNSCEKRYFLFLLAVSDCNRLDTSFFFIVTNVILLWSGWTKNWSKLGSLSYFVDLHWSIYLPYTSKASITWKNLVQRSELVGKFCLHCPPRLCTCPQATVDVPLSHNLIMLLWKRQTVLVKIPIVENNTNWQLMVNKGMQKNDNLLKTKRLLKLKYKL